MNFQINNDLSNLPVPAQNIVAFMLDTRPKHWRMLVNYIIHFDSPNNAWSTLYATGTDCGSTQSVRDKTVRAYAKTNRIPARLINDISNQGWCAAVSCTACPSETGSVSHRIKSLKKLVEESIESGAPTELRTLLDRAINPE
ncbi:hypothetical protein DV711_06235 [Motiliproteus coralliicola]|uniref:Uncharacterized protein n=1 Tax=Motiliproteus coralliicola TaxID=2283196 RepID=A0A369WU70_9GAMM|nr:hypothetical protein [Motiliproteus coralliicola]RDE25151.1 hypothetical protein DV711_06235 [Motiliproteus coralliicola]